MPPTRAESAPQIARNPAIAGRSFMISVIPEGCYINPARFSRLRICTPSKLAQTALTKSTAMKG